jgi:hypothetical protein
VTGAVRDELPPEVVEMGEAGSQIPIDALPDAVRVKIWALFNRVVQVRGVVSVVGA